MWNAYRRPTAQSESCRFSRKRPHQGARPAVGRRLAGDCTIRRIADEGWDNRRCPPRLRRVWAAAIAEENGNITGMCRPATVACGGNQSPGASHPDFSGDQLRCLFPETPLQNRAIGNQKTAPIARSRPSFRFIQLCPVMPPLAWQFAGTPSPH